MAEGERPDRATGAKTVGCRVLLGLAIVVALVAIATLWFVGTNLGLQCAVRNSDLRGARLALNLGADPSLPGRQGFTPLHWAVSRGDEAIAELLLRRGADPAAVDEYGYTPLCWACAAPRPRLVRLLLQHRANPNTPIAAGEVAGTTPLMLAAATHDVESIHGLIAAGATVDARAPTGDTALSLAALVKNLETVRVLLEAGANPDGGGKGVFTPLYWAVSLGHRDVAELLLAHGATPWPQDKRARRLLDRALARHPELRPVLEKYAHRQER